MARKVFGSTSFEVWLILTSSPSGYVPLAAVKMGPVMMQALLMKEASPYYGFMPVV